MSHDHPDVTQKVELVHTDALTNVTVKDNQYVVSPTDGVIMPTLITIHTGNPAECVTGVSLESLLAICRHRLETHNSNGHPCKENNIAIECCSAAIGALEVREARRIKEGLLGTTTGS